MGQLLLFIVVALVVAAIVFGVTVMVSGGDPGLTPVEPDGKALPLPVDRPLVEDDVARSRFDMVFRGYRMAQVDQALQRAAYDIGYKNELIGVLEAEVSALREGRTADADTLRRAREASAAPSITPVADPSPAPTPEPKPVPALAVAPAGEETAAILAGETAKKAEESDLSPEAEEKSAAAEKVEDDKPATTEEPAERR